MIKGIVGKTNFISKALLLLFTMVLIGCGTDGTSVPEGAYKKIVDAVKDEDWDYVYENLDDSSKESIRMEMYRVEARERMEKRQSESRNKRKMSKADLEKERKERRENIKNFQIDRLASKELFMSALDALPQLREALSDTDYEVLNAKESNNRAILSIKYEGGKRGTANLVKVDEKWKLVLQLRTLQSSKTFLKNKQSREVNK